MLCPFHKEELFQDYSGFFVCPVCEGNKTKAPEGIKEIIPPGSVKDSLPLADMQGIGAPLAEEAQKIANELRGLSPNEVIAKLMRMRNNRNE